MTITFTILIDQEKVAFDYDPNPTNGILVWDDRECMAEITFDPETLGLRTGPVMSTGEPITRQSMPIRFSPFMETVRLHKDPIKFQQAKEHRFKVLEAAERVSRLVALVGNGKWDLAEKAFLDLTENAIWPKSVEEMILNVRNVLVEHQSPLIIQDMKISNVILQTFSRAVNRDHTVTDSFCSEYLASRRLSSMWKQIESFRAEFMAKAWHIMPILQIRTMKREPREDELEKYVVYNKQFDELKTLYISGFETLARLSVVFLALHWIAEHGSTDVPANKRNMTIWEFEEMKTAGKANHLKGTPGEFFFVPHLDTALRNGVGHNQAHYDGEKDEIVIYKPSGAALAETRMPYTLFVLRVMQLCSTLLEADALVFHVMERTAGKTT